MIKIPNEIIQDLLIYCQKDDIGFAQVGDDNVTMILIGDRRLSETQVCMIAAHILLTAALNSDQKLKVVEEDENGTRH